MPTPGSLPQTTEPVGQTGGSKPANVASGTDGDASSGIGDSALAGAGEFEGNTFGAGSSANGVVAEHCENTAISSLLAGVALDAEYNGGWSTSNTTVLDRGGAMVGGVGSTTEPSLLRDNVSGCSDDGKLSAGVDRDGVVAESNGTISAGMEESSVPDASVSGVAGCGTGSAAKCQVRCVRCSKVRPPQQCPVCQCLVASLPDHIGNHSGRNPYAISSLLGLKAAETAESGQQDGVEVGQVAGSRRRKKHRVPKQCNICGRTYTKLAEHVARMHGDGSPAMCPDCGKFLRNATTLRAHLASRTCHKSRVCPVCQRSCENDAGLKSHMRSHATADSGAAQSSREFFCDECRHTFPTSEALESHLALHAALSHACCVCGRTFIHAASLRLHLRSHTGEMPFQCRVCGKDFRSRRGLAEHQSIHTMERRYCCAACGRRFRLRRTYARHMLIHSGVKRYTCDDCGARFAFAHLLQRHMRTHYDDAKPHLCGSCGEEFPQWSALHEHRQRGDCARQQTLADAISPPNQF